jgi:hypothetical protein
MRGRERDREGGVSLVATPRVPDQPGSCRVATVDLACVIPSGVCLCVSGVDLEESRWPGRALLKNMELLDCFPGCLWVQYRYNSWLLPGWGFSARLLGDVCRAPQAYFITMCSHMPGDLVTFKCHLPLG